jgi:ATP/maltotriose-dependent transcriptional regulator MalT
LHPLLRDYLEARAEQTGTVEEVAARKQHAVRVLEAHGHFEAAAALLVRLRDWTGLEAQIQRHAESLVAQARGQTLAHWINLLPEANRGENPCLYRLVRPPLSIRAARIPRVTRALRLFTRSEPVSTAGVRFNQRRAGDDAA